MLDNAFDLNYSGTLICGVDEAGRGPLAGPVYAAAVILPENTIIDGLDDSKKLSEKKRQELYDIICTTALSHGIACASVEEIEEMNILSATYLAMNRAIEMLDLKPELALIDGNRSEGIACRCQCVVKGDTKSMSIAAASILAKVTRDRVMEDISQRYPEYRFEKHKGYGTKLHYEMLDEYGLSPVHRRSFLKKYLKAGRL